jgi:hypothetical protein
VRKRRVVIRVKRYFVMFKGDVTRLKLPVMGSGVTLILLFCHLTVKLLMEMKMFVLHARVHLDVATIYIYIYCFFCV